MDSLSVATLADGMMTDAWNYFSSKQDSTENVAMFIGNRDIRGLL